MSCLYDSVALSSFIGLSLTPKFYLTKGPWYAYGSSVAISNVLVGSYLKMIWFVELSKAMFANIPKICSSLV